MVVVEDTPERAAAATMAEIAMWPEVLNTSLVYEYPGPDAPSTSTPVEAYTDWRSSLSDSGPPFGLGPYSKRKLNQFHGQARRSVANCPRSRISMLRHSPATRPGYGAPDACQSSDFIKSCGPSPPRPLPQASPSSCMRPTRPRRRRTRPTWPCADRRRAASAALAAPSWWACRMARWWPRRATRTRR
ncbi:MAG: chaperone NapD [Ideonella sp.]|nr:chaperone NapD [Ideonella sp.]